MEYSLITEPISDITADLDIIAKYHNGTKSLIDSENNNTVTAQAHIKLMFAKHGDEAQLVDDYNYGKTASETLPDISHAGNLLVLVRNILDMDWGFYSSYNMETIQGDSINLHSELEQLLTELKILKEQSKSEGILQTKVKLRKLNQVGNSEVPYDIANMGVIINSLDENKEIITLLINNRLKQISSFDYLYTHLFQTLPIDWEISDIDTILKYVKQPFPDYRAKWLLGRYATQTILAFLKGEMDWNQGNKDVTQSQGVLIYTLLLLFGIVQLDIEDDKPKFLSDRDKAKLIRSFLREDLKNKEVEFYKNIFNLTPVKNLKS